MRRCEADQEPEVSSYSWCLQSH